MISILKESEKPKSLPEKLSEYLAKPPQPVLRFYGDFRTEVLDNKKQILFALRNGLPLPLLYGVYVEVRYDSFSDYIEQTDHIGPFSIDNWRLVLNSIETGEVEIRLGLVPMEILTDRVKIVV